MNIELFEVIKDRVPTADNSLYGISSISVSFINPYSYWLAKQQNTDIYSKFDFICFDGFIFPIIVRAILGIKTPRISFDMTSLAPKVFEDARLNNQSIYFVGSTQENIEKFINVFKTNYPEINISGFRNGYFNDDEREIFKEELKQIKPDLMIVGMGTPYQDILIANLIDELPMTSFYTCGGFFHQSIEGVKYYPDWIDKFNLRWLYRIYDEPKLFKRYFLYYPVSITHFIMSCVKYRLKYGRSSEKR